MQSNTRDRSGTLREAVDGAVDGWPGVSCKTMFGCPSYVADGVLFAVVSDQGLSLTRLTDEQRSELATEFSVRPFDADGRRVRKWATVNVSPADLDAALPALKQSYEAAVV